MISLEVSAERVELVEIRLEKNKKNEAKIPISSSGNHTWLTVKIKKGLLFS